MLRIRLASCRGVCFTTVLLALALAACQRHVSPAGPVRDGVTAMYEAIDMLKSRGVDGYGLDGSYVGLLKK